MNLLNQLAIAYLDVEQRNLLLKIPKSSRNHLLATRINNVILWFYVRNVEIINQAIASNPDLNALDLERSDFVFGPYLHRSNLRAAWQITSTFLPTAFLWLLLSRLINTPLPIISKVLCSIPLLILLALFSSRAFSLMHDCGHGSLFRSQRLNKIFGFFLGVFNAIPQHPWSRGHAYHHKHNGNWQVYKGPSALITLDQYSSLTKRGRLLYKISRHPIMLFPGGFFYLVIKPRIFLILGSFEFVSLAFYKLINYLFNRKHFEEPKLKNIMSNNGSSYWHTNGEMLDLIANNILVLFTWYLMSNWLGIGVFLTFYSVVMTLSAAIFICVFFVQHNFESSYAHRTDDWSCFQGAIEGSSNLNIPMWLNWFFADISYHSIHHLCERIPNYHLRACHERNKHLLVNAKFLRLKQIPDCFVYLLWDSKEQRLVSFHEADEFINYS